MMSGRIIPIILGKGWRFPGIGPPPTFWSFMVSLRTVLVLVDVLLNVPMYYNEHIMRLLLLLDTVTSKSLSYQELGPYHSFKGCALPPSLLLHSPLSFTLILSWEAEGQLPAVTASRLRSGVDPACQGVKFSECLI